MAKRRFRVKPYRHPRLKFVVRSNVTGKWERRFFRTKAEAETYAAQKEIELLNQGSEAMAFPTELRVMAQRAARQLAEYKKTIGSTVLRRRGMMREILGTCFIRDLPPLAYLVAGSVA